MMEFFSAPTLNFSAPGFTGPVLALAGEYDFMCGGYCPGVFGPDVAAMFPNSVAFESYIQPDTAHMLNSGVCPSPFPSILLIT